jgi:HAD superfamily hydrolase (TIGR01509 family)
LTTTGGPLPDAVVFDLDGTIVDTEQPSFEAWRRTWADHGHELRLEDWVLCVGRDWDLFDPLASLEARVGAGFDADAAATARRALEKELVAATVVRAGVELWLDEADAAGVPVGLASSSPRFWVDEHLARLGLADRFATVQTRTEVGVTKPDPAAYLAACAALGVEPPRALAVEDSANGLAAASAAGMPTVVFPNPVTAGLDLSAADLLVPDLAAWTLTAAWTTITAGGGPP